MSSASPHIAIIGAGLTGQIAALALIDALPKNGSKTQNVSLIGPPPGGSDSRAFFLSPASVNMLGALGLLDGLPRQDVTHMDIRDAANGVASRDMFELSFDSAPADDGISAPLGILVRAQDLSRAVDEKLAQVPLTRITQPAAHIDNAAACANITLASGQTLTSDLAVIADGRHSPMRKALGIEVTGADYRQTGVVSVLSHSAPHKGRAFQFFLPGGPLATLPLPDADGTAQSALVWTLPTRAAAAAMALGPQDFAAELSRHLPPALGPLISATPAQGFPLILQLAKTYTAPHAVLIGDAAHVIHPLAGQGLNLGFRDIAALVDVITEGRAAGMALGGAPMLSEYGRWRRADAAQLAAATDALGRIFRARLPGLGHIRRLGMAAINRAAPVKALITREASGQTGQIPTLLQ